MVRLLCALFALLFTFAQCEKVVLERPQGGRFEEEVFAYAKKQRSRRNCKWIKRGLLVGGASLGAIGFAYKMFWGSGGNRGGDGGPQVAQPPVAADDFWSLCKKNFVYYAISGAIAASVSASTKFLHTLKKFLWEDNFEVVSALRPLNEVMNSSILRLACAMRELNSLKKASPFFKHYICEMKDAFSLYVRFLEKLSAVLLCELKASGVESKDVVLGCAGQIDRLFAFCGHVAGAIEADVNVEQWGGFSVQSFDLLKNIKDSSASLLVYIPLLSGKPLGAKHA